MERCEDLRFPKCQNVRRVNTVENSAVLTEQDDHRNDRSAAASEDRGEHFEVRAHESRENLLLTELNKPQYSFKNTNYA